MYIKGGFFEIRVNEDPSGTGMCRGREINAENNEKDIPDEQLRWLQPLRPVGKEAVGGFGESFFAPPVGTVAFCVFHPDDHDCRYPIMLGSIVRTENVGVDGIQQKDPKTGAKKPKNQNPDTSKPVVQGT